MKQYVFRRHLKRFQRKQREDTSMDPATTQIEYTCQLWREGDFIIAHAMPLDVMSAGKTEEEARNALEEAVTLFLRTAETMGTLEQVLEDAGYARVGDTWTGPDWVSVEKHTLSLVA